MTCQSPQALVTSNNADKALMWTHTHGQSVLSSRSSYRARTINKKTGPDQFSNLCDLDRPIQYLVQ